jgi:hypothetical protein
MPQAFSLPDRAHSQQQPSPTSHSAVNRLRRSRAQSIPGSPARCYQPRSAPSRLTTASHPSRYAPRYPQIPRRSLFASSPSGVASDDRLLIGAPGLPTSQRFLVRLKGAVSSSRPDDPQGARAQARSRMAEGHRASLRGAQRP